MECIFREAADILTKMAIYKYVAANLYIILYHSLKDSSELLTVLNRTIIKITIMIHILSEINVGYATLGNN